MPLKPKQRKVIDILIETKELVEEQRKIRSKLHNNKLLIAEWAEYNGESKTGHLIMGGFHAVISEKITQNFDQKKLVEIKNHLADEFNSIFKPTYKPISASILHTALNEGGEKKDAIEYAMKPPSSSYSVEFKEIETE